MPEPLLNVLKICLLILLYLFFFRVLRAVWAEVDLARAAAPASSGSGRRGRRSRAGGEGQPRRTRARERTLPKLKVIEPVELAGTVYPLGDELTVGRAAGCQITLDDTYASQLHARLFMRDEQLYVEDLGSTNGTYLNRRKVTGPMVVSQGDQIKVGSTVMEVT
ncbi:MAG TPA: FHA domain-containing protein [Acidimicrobiales bacterium]|nr:FHA domain-containing protein [Acidimicrobiales bacterium]